MMYISGTIYSAVSVKMSVDAIYMSKYVPVKAVLE